MRTSTYRTIFWSGFPVLEGDSLRILGVDPGLSATGYGILEKQELLGYGVIVTHGSLSLPERLLVLTRRLSGVISKFQPDRCAIESLFFKGGGARSVILSAHARGVLLGLLARRKVPVFELTPATIKLAVTGNGRAAKHQVNYMIREVLRLDGKVPEHAADALAAAYCLARRIASGVALRTAGVR